MHDRFLIKVNIERLKLTLSRSERRQWVDQEVRDWLARNGFLAGREGWTVEVKNLRLLDATEYTVIRQL